MRRLIVRVLVLLATLALALAVVAMWSDLASLVHRTLLWPIVGTSAVLAWLVRHRLARALAFTNIAVLLAGTVGAAWSAARPTGTADPSERFDVISYNVLFRGGQPQRTVELLAATDADVLCLQEVTPGWVKRLEQLAGDYPYQLVRPNRFATGLAMLSRYPLEREVNLDSRPGQPVAHCAHVPAKDVVLCNVHLYSIGVFDAGKILAGYDANADLRRRQWRELMALVDATYPQATSLIIAGDFNTLDTEPLYREIRGRFVDSFAAAGRGEAETFPNLGRAGSEPLIRIDYVFTSPNLTPIAAEVLTGGGSDHRGLRAALRIKQWLRSSS